MSPSSAHAEPLRFATGPFRATAAETRAQWEPLVRFLGQALEMQASLTVCEDWEKLGDTMERDGYDLAWMGGGWRYVQAHARGAGPAIATVTVAGSPVCHAVVIAGRNVAVCDFPHDARGLSLSFTHHQSTTGWLAVYAALLAQGIDPESYFQCSAGNQHAENVFAVTRGTYDLATDSDRNRQSMVGRGMVVDADVRVVWRSEALPLDPIIASNRLAPDLVLRVQQALIRIDTAAALALPMPAGYTGFVAATDASYTLIREAADLVHRNALQQAMRRSEPL
jgi:phosphonate transport system substrate-binding protein